MNNIGGYVVVTVAFLFGSGGLLLFLWKWTASDANWRSLIAELNIDRTDLRNTVRERDKQLEGCNAKHYADELQLQTKDATIRILQSENESLRRRLHVYTVREKYSGERID